MNIVTPKIELIASTTLTNMPEGGPKIEDWMSLDPSATDAENLIEFSGRSCYQSFHRPNPKTAKNLDYLTRTLFDQNHWSIAEHATATLYATGVSRALTHELIRHRHLSYSQLSQRFVDESDANVVEPPALRGEPKNPNEKSLWESQIEKSIENYEREAQGLMDIGYGRKQAREAARSHLPNAVETRIVVTGNHRAWAEVILRRIAPDADAEIRGFSRLALEALRPAAPTIYKEVDRIIGEMETD